MPSSAIAPQDPSMSPTYAISTNQSQHNNAGSIRRNLFAGHLSRRPPAASNSQNPFESSALVSNEQPQNNVFLSAPTAQSSRRSLGFNDIYDPNASPPPPAQVVSHSTTTLPRENIVALHPVTGRPLLPVLPSLPPRLRLSEGDEGEEEASDLEHEQHHGGHTAGFTRSPSYHSGLNHLSKDFELEQDADLDSSELERLTTYHNASSSSMRLNINQFLDTTSEETHADGERIEYLLLEMTARQRARARTIPTPESSMSTLQDPSIAGSSRGMSMSTSAQSAGTSVLSSSRRRAGGAGGANFASNPGKQAALKQSRRDPSPQKTEYHTHIRQHSGGIGTDPSTLPVGKVIDPLEKEELVGLIMTSLRRKVAVADEEGWMYGDGDGMGIGAGALGLEGEPFD